MVQSVTYHPFGGVNGFTLGNGQVYSRPRDQDGRVASYTLGTQGFTVGYDGQARVWDTETARLVSTFTNHGPGPGNSPCQKG